MNTLPNLPNQKEINMRRFIGYRPNPPADYLARGVAVPPDEPQYEGCVFADGSVALRWRTEFRSTSLWACFEDFYQVHGHPEYGTRIEWLDAAPEVAPADPITDPCGCSQFDPPGVHQRGDVDLCLDTVNAGAT